MVLRRSKPLALVSALTLVGGLFIAQWHRATEVHAYCTEHGEVIHSQHGHHLDQVPAASEERAELHDVHAAELGSHGCAMLDFLSHGNGALANATGLGTMLPSVDKPRSAAQRPAFDGDRYRLCPKTSPPTLA